VKGDRHPDTRTNEPSRRGGFRVGGPRRGREGRAGAGRAKGDAGSRRGRTAEEAEAGAKEKRIGTDEARGDVAGLKARARIVDAFRGFDYPRRESTHVLPVGSNTVGR
jgi:hypothetical protein